MQEDRAAGGGWLRPLGLLALALMLAVGQPLVVVVVAFTMLTFLAPGGGLIVLLLTAFAFAALFADEPSNGLWYLERGWAILLGGWFVALSLALPSRSFVVRGLSALLGGVACVACVLLAVDGWGGVDELVADRVEASMAATVEIMTELTDRDLQTEMTQALTATAEVQGILFPALLGLSSLASLGVAWWMHVRVSPRSGSTLRPLREFRFPDPLIWVFISGLILVLLAEWSVGWGRLGTNLVAFMGALYMLRGTAVLMVLWGGISVTGGLLLAVILVLAGPLVAFGAMLIGVGDSWLDLRARLAPEGTAGE